MQKHQSIYDAGMCILILGWKFYGRKVCFLTEIPPLSLVFYRWLLVWIILLPFTYKEILNIKKQF